MSRPSPPAHPPTEGGETAAEVIERLGMTPIPEEGAWIVEGPRTQELSAATVLLTAAPEGFAPGRVARIRQRGERRFHGIRIEQPVPDWSGFDALSFTVATIGPESSELRVRIHDETYAGEPGDRFVRSTPIGPEPATVRITLEEIRNAPANRPMDLTDIDRVLFDMPAAEFVDFYIDDLRFE